MMHRVLILLQGDVKNSSRDSMLCMTLAAPVLMILAGRFLLPLLESFIREEWGYELAVHYPFISGFLLLLIPLLLGTLMGFLIVEERDMAMILYYSVTPLTRSGYILYRLSVPVVLGWILSLLMMWGVNLVLIPLPYIVLLSGLSSLEGSMIAMFLGSYARNRVESLALAKGLGIVLLAPVVGYVLPFPYHLFGGVLPPYWITQGFLWAWEGKAVWPYLLGGVLSHGLLLLFLYRRFVRGMD